MSLKIGQNSVNKIYTFDQEVNKIYNGSTEIYTPPSWSPLDLNPDLWLDASDASTIHLSDATHVEQWDDKSVNGNNALQPILAQQPQYDSINNRIWFQDINRLIDINLTSISNNNFTIIFCGRATVDTQVVMFCFRDSTTDVAGFNNFEYQNRNGDNLTYFVGDGVSYVFPVHSWTVGAVPFPDLTIQNSIFEVFSSGSFDRRNIVNDAETLAVAPWPTYNEWEVSVPYLTLGNRRSGQSIGRHSEFNEVFVWKSKLSDADRALIVQYLKDKWQ